MKKLSMQLFTTDRAGILAGNLRKLQRIFNENIESEYDINIVDVISNPEKALQEDIIATPTLLISTYTEDYKIIGDIYNAEKVLPLINRIKNNESIYRVPQLT